MVIEVSCIRKTLLILQSLGLLWFGIASCDARVLSTQWEFSLVGNEKVICEIVQEGQDWYQVRILGARNLRMIRKSQIINRQPDEADAKELEYTDGRTEKVWIEQEGDTWLRIRTGVEETSVSVIERTLIKKLTSKDQDPAISTPPPPVVPLKEPLPLKDIAAPVEKRVAAPALEVPIRKQSPQPATRPQTPEPKASNDKAVDESQNLESIGKLAFQKELVREPSGSSDVVYIVLGLAAAGTITGLIIVMKSRR